METLKRQVADALTTIGTETPNARVVVARTLDVALRERIILEYVDGVHAKLMRRPTADPRQGWLALPEWEHLPVEIAYESLEGLRARIAKITKRLATYERPRSSPEKVKGDKKELRALKRLEVQIAPLFANDPTMTVSRAAQLQLQAPVSVRSRSANKVRWGRTKNQ